MSKIKKGETATTLTGKKFVQVKSEKELFEVVTPDLLPRLLSLAEEMKWDIVQFLVPDDVTKMIGEVIISSVRGFQSQDFKDTEEKLRTLKAKIMEMAGLGH